MTHPRQVLIPTLQNQKPALVVAVAPAKALGRQRRPDLLDGGKAPGLGLREDHLPVDADLETAPTRGLKHELLDAVLVLS